MNMNLSGTKSGLLSVSERQVASGLFNFEGLIQKHFHAEVEAQTVMYFLLVASTEEAVDVSYAATTLKISKAAASRNFYRLSDGLGGEGGLDLIKAQVDYRDRRRLMMVLTPKGTEVARELIKHSSTKLGGGLKDADSE